MRCKACDTLFGESEQIFRVVTLPGEEPLRVLETLCRKCRATLDQDEDDEIPCPTIPRQEEYDE